MSGETILVIDDSPTILKVVQLVLAKAGFSVETAPDGEEGLKKAREVNPQLILLDFVMPKMNGYQVCRELAHDKELKDIAVVLMSAKGDQVGERFVKVMGIVDYITKPFSPEAITAVVQHSVEKYGRRSPGEYTRPILKGAADDLAKGRTDEKAAEQQEQARQQALDRARQRILEAFNRADLSALGVDATPEKLAELVELALDNDELGAIVDSAEAAIVSGAGSPSLRGDLRVIPIADVLQLMDTQHQSGLLTVERGSSRVEVSFSAGSIELATATGIDEEFLLGRFIVEAAMMTPEDLDRFLESRNPSSKLIGTQLVKLGYLSEDGLRAALTEQTREVIYEALRWNFGTFRFRRTRDLPVAAAHAALSLDVDGILMEGFRRVDEWHLIEREVDDFDQVFLRNEDAVVQMGRSRLTRDELGILELVNGKNTVKEIIRASRMGSFEVSKMLYRLLSIKLVRPRVSPVAV